MGENALGLVFLYSHECLLITAVNYNRLSHKKSPMNVIGLVYIWLKLSAQEFFKRFFADAVGVADLFGFQRFIVDGCHDILF